MKYIKLGLLLTPGIILAFIIYVLSGQEERMDRVYLDDVKNLDVIVSYVKEKKEKYNLCIEPLEEGMKLEGSEAYLKYTNKFREFASYTKLCDDKSLKDFYTKEEIKKLDELFKEFKEKGNESSNKHFPLVNQLIQVIIKITA